MCQCPNCVRVVSVFFRANIYLKKTTLYRSNFIFNEYLLHIFFEAKDDDIISSIFCSDGLRTYRFLESNDNITGKESSTSRELAPFTGILTVIIDSSYRYYLNRIILFQEEVISVVSDCYLQKETVKSNLYLIEYKNMIES